MQRSKFRFPMVAAAALAVVGATPTGQSASLYPDNPDATPQKTVLVSNHNSLDVEVVAVTEAGRRFRLGAVRRGAGRTFTLPRGVTDNSSRFRLKVYSIGQKVGPSLVNHYVDAVKTQLLSSSVEGELVLQVHSPLANSFIDRGSSGRRQI